MGEILKFENVYFSYNNHGVLENVNFSVQKGDFVSVIGPNGGGKTTLAKLALGLVMPDSGNISLFEHKPQHTRALVGYIPQFSLFDPKFPVSVLEVVLMGIMTNTKFFFSRGDREKALQVLNHVGLDSVVHNAFSDLSGGQRQRVLIARALITEPQMLIMDEPTASVDTAVEEQLSTLLKELKEKLAIILITHDLGFVSNLVTKIICVNKKVNIHPASEITKEHIKNLYNQPVKVVRHDIKEVN